MRSVIEFSNKDKLDCARRELKLRIRAYAKLVGLGKMTEQAAAREIALMGAIVDDYARLVEPQLDLQQ
jgi:hypothetical protein